MIPCVLHLSALCIVLGRYSATSLVKYSLFMYVGLHLQCSCRPTWSYIAGGQSPNDDVAYSWRLPEKTVFGMRQEFRMLPGLEKSAVWPKKTRQEPFVRNLTVLHFIGGVDLYVQVGFVPAIHFTVAPSLCCYFYCYTTKVAQWRSNN